MYQKGSLKNLKNQKTGKITVSIMTLQETCTMKSNLKNKFPKQDLHDKDFSGLASVDGGNLTRPTHLDGKFKSIEIERGVLCV